MKTQNWAIILADQLKTINFLLGLVETFFYENQIKNAKKVILDVFSCQKL
jgi:hypothetical protein